MPVVERQTRRLLGLISLHDLLAARTRHLEEERRPRQRLKFTNYFSEGRRKDGTPPIVITSEVSR
jgi:hypothetical protein